MQKTVSKIGPKHGIGIRPQNGYGARPQNGDGTCTKNWDACSECERAHILASYRRLGRSWIHQVWNMVPSLLLGRKLVPMMRSGAEPIAFFGTIFVPKFGTHCVPGFGTKCVHPKMENSFFNYFFFGILFFLGRELTPKLGRKLVPQLGTEIGDDMAAPRFS